MHETGQPHRPLLRRRSQRTLVAIALVLTTLLALLPAAWLVLIEGRAWIAVPALLALAVLPLATRPVDLGRWSAGGRGRAEQAAIALFAALAALAAAYAVVRGVDALATRNRLGTPSGEIARWFAAAVPAIAGVALLLASVPLALPRRGARLAVGAVVGTAIAAGAGAATVQAGPDGCAGFRLDGDAWRAGLRDAADGDGERVAEAIVRCGTLDGATRAEVQRLLGPSDRGSASGEWSRQVGIAGDAVGPGDARSLTLLFADGRVREAWLSGGEYAGD